MKLNDYILLDDIKSTNDGLAGTVRYCTTDDHFKNKEEKETSYTLKDGKITFAAKDEELGSIKDELAEKVQYTLENESDYEVDTNYDFSNDYIDWKYDNDKMFEYVSRGEAEDFAESYARENDYHKETNRESMILSIGYIEENGIENFPDIYVEYGKPRSWVEASWNSDIENDTFEMNARVESGHPYIVPFEVKIGLNINFEDRYERPDQINYEDVVYFEASAASGLSEIEARRSEQIARYLNDNTEENDDLKEEIFNLVCSHSRYPYMENEWKVACDQVAEKYQEAEVEL